MKKVAIRFTFDEQFEFDELKQLAQHIQRFVVEGDYKLSTIVRQLEAHERIELDVGMEENMPEFSELVAEFDEDNIDYKLYKQLNDGWEECELDDLELDRTPKWIVILVGVNLIWYMVMIVVEFFFIYDWCSEKYEWGGVASTVAAFFIANIPVYGSLVAYWSATELAAWGSYGALFVFFGHYLPLVGFFIYVGWLILKALYADRWYRFWRPEFN